MSFVYQPAASSPRSSVGRPLVMADSDDGSHSQRDSHYNQQRSSLRSDRSLRTPSRPGSSQLLHDFTLRDHHGLPPRDTPPSPAPVVPTRTHSRAHSDGQRSKHSSRRGSGRATRSGSRGGDEAYNLPDSYGNLNEILCPSPVEDLREQQLHHPASLEGQPAPSQASRAARRARKTSKAREQDAYDVPDSYRNINDVGTPRDYDLFTHVSLEDERQHSRGSRRPKGSRRSSLLPRSLRTGRNTPATDLEVTALPAFQSPNGKRPESSTAWDRYQRNKSPSHQAASRIATELYTVSYLVIFSILGTLARLGLQWLTFYPGAPAIFPVLWANFAGTLLLGFLAQDSSLFREEWGGTSRTPSNDEELALELTESRIAAAHAKVKKTIPLYIGLATGFCGSFTSFSSFMRDAFFALSNDLPSPINHPSPAGAAVSTSLTVSRNGGYSFMAVCAVVILTVALCHAAFKAGAHLAIYIKPVVPILPFLLLRRILDPLMVFIAWSAWLGAVFLAIWPPDRPGGPSSHGSWANETWRGQAVFACVFAPLGCLLRFYVSLKLNGLAPSFPLGTFCVNIFGSAVLGMVFDLQHVQIDSGLPGGGRVGCQVLQGIMDGFCGALTTVSTWIAEINGLRRGHGWTYAFTSVAVGLGTLVVIMGSVRWTVGWTEASCVT
ncbi:hypothetical protein EJ04DRAFT_513107 [Polyplosphaeria fusca]|uniref:Chromosome condensation protein n=1 Tax=Polyplosphaeria fusca TaxID=682080 RepID=A0A9P4V1V5_9PLEO|nr:hypothetical protein EJ04DRAFT_513107 [Polyplosphaeria fusca]